MCRVEMTAKSQVTVLRHRRQTPLKSPKSEGGRTRRTLKTERPKLILCSLTQSNTFVPFGKRLTGPVARMHTFRSLRLASAGSGVIVMATVATLLAAGWYRIQIRAARDGSRSTKTTNRLAVLGRAIMVPKPSGLIKTNSSYYWPDVRPCFQPPLMTGPFIPLTWSGSWPSPPVPPLSCPPPTANVWKRSATIRSRLRSMSGGPASS